MAGCGEVVGVQVLLSYSRAYEVSREEKKKQPGIQACVGTETS